MTFKQWMSEVNKLFTEMFGLDSDCFEDWDYYSAYEEELTPTEAFQYYIEDNDIN